MGAFADGHVADEIHGQLGTSDGEDDLDKVERLGNPIDKLQSV